MSITSLEMSLHLKKRIWKMSIVTQYHDTYKTVIAARATCTAKKHTLCYLYNNYSLVHAHIYCCQGGQDFLKMAVVNSSMHTLPHYAVL